MSAESFIASYTGISQSASSTVNFTMDNLSAVAAPYLMVRGYTGTDLIQNPTTIVTAYSDDNSSWTTHETKSSLTNLGAAGSGRWSYMCDIDGEVHRYWRVTLTHGNQWMFVSSMELHGRWFNAAFQRPYTVSPAADGNFPNNVLGYRLFSGDSDWVSSGGKLTDGDHGTYASFGTGVGWNLASSATGTARVDLGSALTGDHILVRGIHGNGTNMVTPSRVVVAYSDDDSSWTDVFDKNSLTVVQNAQGRWAAHVDISGESAHRYWRAVITKTGSGQFLTMTQLEFWQELAGGPAEQIIDVDPAEEAEEARSAGVRLEVNSAVETEDAVAATVQTGEIISVTSATRMRRPSLSL
jgi:hypothetical protein